MAITSIGYPGTVDAVAWATWGDELGQKYGIRDFNDFKTTVVVGPDRTVSISTGVAYGRGVMDTSNAAVSLQLATVSSGTRYDTIVLHRVWGSTNATTLTIVQGTSAASVSSSIVSNPGVSDDQPIALVQVNAGSTSIGSIVDLREFPAKVRTAYDLRALKDPTFGDQAIVGGFEYSYAVAPGGSTPSWVKGVPDSVKVRLNSTITGFGAGVTTGLVGFVTQTQTGQTANLSHSNGFVTVNVDGVYALSFDFAASVSGWPSTDTTGYVEVSLRAGSTVLCRAQCNNLYDVIVNGSKTVYLSAGTVVNMSLFNSKGTLSASPDSTAAPFNFTVTRIAG